MTARRVGGHDDAADRATGESAGILGAAGVSTGPSIGPAIFCCSPAIPNGSSATTGIATANGHATICAIAYVGPGTSGLSGAAALIVGVRLLQAPLIYGTVILIVSTVTVLWPWRAEFSRHYWWVWLALGGIILIVAAARYEASLKSMRTIAARIGDLR